MTATVAPPPWPAQALATPWRLGRPWLADGATASGPSHPWDLQWDLRRPCSLTPRQLGSGYLAACALSTLIALGFSLNGAPVVLLFSALELTILGGCLLLFARHARDGETLTLVGQDFRVDQACGPSTDSIHFRAEWVSVEPSHGDGSLIELSGQGQRVVVGRFIRPELRMDLARELRQALRMARQPAFRSL